MNNVILIGNLTKEPESNGGVVKGTVAVKRSFTNKDGVYESDFINFVAFSKTGELIQKHFHKGDRIGMEGEWRTGSYQNKDGKTVYTNDLVVNKIEFLQLRKEEKQVKAERQKIATQDDPYANIDEQFTEEDAGLPF